MKKLFGFILCVFLLMAILGIFRAPILRIAGNGLIYQDSLQVSEALVVLSGSAFERGNKGAELLKNGFAKKIICPGGNLDMNYLILYNDSIYEGDITKKKIVQSGVADSLVVALHEGTSTLEEAESIYRYCLKEKIRSIIVVSSFFHTARVHRVYQKCFNNSGIRITIQGANSIRYDEQNWWRSEDGLIGFNNEWMKTIYYYFNH